MAMKVRVRIELLSVECRDTEDWTGADTIYVLGGLTDGTNKSPIVMTSPIWINDGENKPFNPDPFVIFDYDVPIDEGVGGGMIVKDQDAAKDWERYGPQIKDIKDGIIYAIGLVGAVGTIFIPGSAVGAAKAAVIVQGSYDVAKQLISLDEDDELGRPIMIIPASGPEIETKQINIKGETWKGDWDYSIWYRVIRTFPKLLLNVEPKTIPAGTPIQITINAEDAITHDLVAADVIINDTLVGSTNTPFTYTFEQFTNVSVVSPDYPNTGLKIFPTLHKLSLHVDPYPVPLNKPVTVTIYAEDTETNSPVAGDIIIYDMMKKVKVGSTNTPFTYTFRVRRNPRSSFTQVYLTRLPPEPWPEPEPVPNYPVGFVVALNYESIDIDFGFSENFERET